MFYIGIKPFVGIFFRGNVLGSLVCENNSFPQKFLPLNITAQENNTSKGD